MIPPLQRGGKKGVSPMYIELSLQSVVAFCGAVSRGHGTED